MDEKKKQMKLKESDVVAKLRRKHILEEQRRIKPGECLKYIKVIINSKFFNIVPNLEKKLVEIGVKFEIRDHINLPVTTFERLEQQTIYEKESTDYIQLTEKQVTESHAIILITGQEFIDFIRVNTFNNYIKLVKAELTLYPHLTILIYELKKYCKNNSDFVRRSQIENALIELQLEHCCNHRLFECEDDVQQFLGQYTKAVAETPYKKMQQEKYVDLNLFLLNDNKDCVRVDGNAGLSRLWQQHITRLPSVTLETSEAIINEYPTPQQLNNAYENSSDGSKLLSDIKIRRTGGLMLTSARRIGPELSRKIYTLYTSLDPNELL